MEELKTKFVGNAKMKAQYELYQKKRLALIQTIKNSLQENDLMLEIITGAQQNFEFSANKRKSLILQQNAGYRSHFSPNQDLEGGPFDMDYNDGQIFLTSPHSRYESYSTRNTTTPKLFSRV